MKLPKELDSGYSKASTERIVAWVGKSPQRLAELVTILHSGNPRLQARAAWPLTYCVEMNPDLIKPHLTPMVRMLRKRDLNDGVVRSIVRLLQFVDIPKRLQGEVADHCFRYLSDPGKAPAIRAFAIRVAENLARKNKDLYSELKIILEDQLPYATPAFVSRARRILGLTGCK